MSSRPLRVVFLVSTLRRTGPTTQLLNIVRYLDRHRFAPMIVTISPEPASSMLSSFTELEVPVASLSMGRLQSALRGGWRVAVEHAIGTHLDRDCVIHTQGLRPDVISARHFAGLPRTATARNYPHHDYVMKYGWAAGKLMAWAHLRALRALPAVVACSSSLGKLLQGSSVEAAVIRNGVDTATFKSVSPIERAGLRRELGLSPDARVGVCVGALSRRKDPVSVIRAFEVLPDRNVALLFVGSGDLEGECRDAARDDARIRFTGHVENVAPYLQVADFFVSAAHSEGFPNSVLEAIACGLRVVLSNIDAHGELLDLVPFAGELFDTGDAEAMAAAVARACRQSAGFDGQERDRLIEEISADRMSRQYQELYAQLARGAPPA